MRSTTFKKRKNRASPQDTPEAIILNFRFHFDDFKFQSFIGDDSGFRSEVLLPRFEQLVGERRDSKQRESQNGFGADDDDDPVRR